LINAHEEVCDFTKKSSSLVASLSLAVLKLKDFTNVLEGNKTQENIKKWIEELE
jgi:hypothetical protein